MVLLQLKKLHKKQGDFHLTDISLEVAENEILAVLGESGSGKTSLLRLIAGLEKPDQGEIRLGKDLLANEKKSLRPQQRPICLTFQDAWLFPKMTVSQNIQSGCQGLSKAQKAQQTAEWLELIGLSAFGGRYPHELSGGEQQRIALARALATRPRLMLFDEPFSKLDAPRRARLREDVARLLRHTQTAAILVTHDVQDVYALADRVAILEAGKLVQQGAPAEVYQHPRDAYSARLFGAANIVSGQQLLEMGHPHADAEASYCIRPEQIALTASSDSDAFFIQEQLFHGNSYQLRLKGRHGEWMVNCGEKQEAGGRFGLEILGKIQLSKT